MAVLVLLVGTAIVGAAATAPGDDTADAARSADLTVTGQVTSAVTHLPLASAQVFVPGLRIGSLTDANGRYSLTIPAVHAGRSEWTISVQLIGYGTHTRVLRRDQVVDDRATVDFALQTTALSLDEVVVTGAADAASRPLLTRGGRVDRELASVAVAEASARIRQAAMPSIGLPAPPEGFHARPNREQYGHIEENAFIAVADEPRSTFSVDVDRASYSNIRRFLLREHRLPPVDAVQVEEMVNYFAYDYRFPRGDDPVAVTTELGSAPWRPEHRLLRVGLAARPIDVEDLPPSNLVFLLDVSGSMQSGDKLPLVKRSLRLLVDQLRPEDHVAIVVYAGAAGLVLEPTDGTNRDRIIEAIDRLEAGGSTAGGAGLRLAYDVARRHFRPEGNNRVILATDGDFNIGESSDGAMVRLIEDRRRQGTFLTVLGFGTGNLQNEKMQSIAQHGNGNYAYIDSIEEARKVLVGEMGGTLVTVAKDVKIQIEFNPAEVASYRLLGYENRLLAERDFNDDSKDAGEMGAGHTVTALYEIVPVGAESDPASASVDPLRYQSRPDASAAPADERPIGRDELAFVRVRYKQPDGDVSALLEQPVGTRVRSASTDFTFASAVAGFGMLLRDSEHRGSLTVERVRSLAEDGLGDDPHGYRRGLLQLIDAYAALVATQDRPED
jgi:Ca-activated chloride channel family protein